MLTYQEVLDLRSDCISNNTLSGDIKEKIDNIRKSIQDFIQKNRERKYPYEKRRNINFKKLKKPDILGRDTLTKDINRKQFHI